MVIFKILVALLSIKYPYISAVSEIVYLILCWIFGIKYERK